MCASVPHTPTNSGAMRTSPGPGVGSGTSWVRTMESPRNRTARMTKAFLVRCRSVGEDGVEGRRGAGVVQGAQRAQVGLHELRVLREIAEQLAITDERARLL